MHGYGVYTMEGVYTMSSSFLLHWNAIDAIPDRFRLSQPVSERHQRKIFFRLKRWIDKRKRLKNEREYKNTK